MYRGRTRDRADSRGRSMIDLTGKRVLVTGASRGIGAACAQMFARAGATVLVHYVVRREAAESVLTGLQPANLGEHQIYAADLRDRAQVENLFAHLKNRLGGLDCLVNNAGIWVQNPLADLDADKLEETWRVNELAPFLCAHKALDLLQDSADGNIVNLSSTAGQRGEGIFCSDT